MQWYKIRTFKTEDDFFSKVSYWSHFQSFFHPTLHTPIQQIPPTQMWENTSKYKFCIVRGLIQVQKARRTRCGRRWKDCCGSTTSIWRPLLLTFQSVSPQYLPVSHFLIKSPLGIRLRWSEDRTGDSLWWCEEAKSSSAVSPQPLMLL